MYYTIKYHILSYNITSGSHERSGFGSRPACRGGDRRQASITSVGDVTAGWSCRALFAGASELMCVSLSLSIYIYICLYVYIYIYIYAYASQSPSRLTSSHCPPRAR